MNGKGGGITQEAWKIYLGDKSGSTEDGKFGLQRKKILRVMWDHGSNK